jgi:hypothetical protein
VSSGGARSHHRRISIALAAAAVIVGGLLVAFVALDGGDAGVDSPEARHGVGLSPIPPLAGPDLTRLAAPATTAAPVLETPPPEPAASEVTITLESRPAAWVYRAGARLGPTPYGLRLTADAAPVELELRQVGYARQRVTLSPTDPSPRTVELEPLPPREDDEAVPWRPKPF